MNLKICFWNIQGFSDQKLSDLCRLDEWDIIGLAETWRSSCICIQGFICECACRKPSRNGRVYGGVAVLCRERRFRSVLRLKSESENIVWLKVKMNELNLVIGAVYIPPQNSSYMKENIWELVSKEMRKYVELYGDSYFILTGDFNAYTGISDGEFEEVGDNWRSNVSRDPSESPWYYDDLKIGKRQSKDQNRRRNKWGSNLLDFCVNEKMVIVNGRLGEDEEVGNFTCFSGSPSVVDYCLVGLNLWPMCYNFRVMGCVGSDHVPIALNLSVPGSQRSICEIRVRSWQREGEISRFTKNDLCIRKPIKIVKETEEIVNQGIIRGSTQELIEECEEFCKIGKVEESIKGLNKVVYDICVGAGESDKIEVRNSEERELDMESKKLKARLQEALDVVRFQRPGTLDNNLLAYRRIRREYKKVVRKCKKMKEEEDIKEIEQALKDKDSKVFWKKVSSSTRRETSQDIPPRTPGRVN